MSQAEARQAAPGDLERVRGLLNTWWIPNDFRVPQDDFSTFARDLNLRGRTSVRELRDDLRKVVEHRADADAVLTSWIERLDLKPVVSEGVVTFRHPGTPAADFLTVVLQSIQEGSWSRLKACPDCRWVFYDHTRNASKRWCVMNPTTSEGRGCGNIAKVRRHRERRKAQRPKRSPASRHR